MNSFLVRLIAYMLQRFEEPTTWAGVTIILTGVGIKIAPDKMEAIATAGMFLAGALMTVSREGRNKPDNPSLPTIIKGAMPPPKAAIVPPNTDGMRPVAKSEELEADPARGVHVENPKP